jgi:hypothetical protein
MNGDDFNAAVEELALRLEQRGLDDEAAQVRTLRWVAGEMIRDFAFIFSALIVLLPAIALAWAAGVRDSGWAIWLTFIVATIAGVAALYGLARLILRFHTARNWPADDR